MQVLFESRDPHGAQMNDVAVRRLRFVLRRLAWLVPRARVLLSDINGPRGGVDKRVQVELKTDVAGTVVVSSVGRDWRSALELALSRASRVLLRTVRRTGSKRHESPESPDQN
jgi:hypothetical protein